MSFKMLSKGGSTLTDYILMNSLYLLKQVLLFQEYIHYNPFAVLKVLLHVYNNQRSTISYNKKELLKTKV